MRWLKLSHLTKIFSEDLGEVAKIEPPHQDLRCLQIQLFSSLVPKELIVLSKNKGYDQPGYSCSAAGINLY